jgi:hypothetical protein
MKTLFLTLLLATLCATGYGQTIKSLGYNTTNGEVVYTGTNVLTFINEVSFDGAKFESGKLEVEDFIFELNWEENFLAKDEIILKWFDDGTPGLFLAEPLSFIGTNAAAAAAATRTNLGLPLPVLTNTNVGNFIGALGLSGTNAIPVEYATALFDMPLDVTALRIEDNEWIVSTGSVTTNAPANTNNAVRWIRVIAGTNTYRLPLFQ